MDVARCVEFTRVVFQIASPRETRFLAEHRVSARAGQRSFCLPQFSGSVYDESHFVRENRTQLEGFANREMSDNFPDYLNIAPEDLGRGT